MTGPIRANCALGHEMTVSKSTAITHLCKSSLPVGEEGLGGPVTGGLLDRLRRRSIWLRLPTGLSVSEIPSGSLKDSEGEYSAEQYVSEGDYC